MKKIILFFMAGLFLVSCSRENDKMTDETLANSAKMQLPTKVTIAENNKVISKRFEYQNDNELKEIIDEGSGERIVFVYEKDFITSKIRYSQAGEELGKTNYQYNNGKLSSVIDEVVISDSGIQYKRVVTREYHYNGSEVSVNENIKYHSESYAYNLRDENFTHTYVLNGENITKIHHEISKNVSNGHFYLNPNNMVIIDEEVTYDAKNSPYKNIKGFSVLAVEFCGLDKDENTIADYLNFRWVSHNPTLIQKSINLYGSGADSSEYKFQYEYKNNFPIKTKLNINNQTVTTMVYEYNK